MLYKYLPAERIDIIENLKIRFSPLLSLNDPFENLPLVDISVEKNVLLSQLILELEEIWEKTDVSEKTVSNRQLLEQTKEKLHQQINEETSPYSVGQQVVNLIGDNLGVLSLSRTEKSLLMWTHYASEGKGFLIGFDDNHSFFRQKDMEGNITKLLPVIYSAKRRKIIIGEESYYQKLLCVKALEWAYEEEERIFRIFLTKENVVGKDIYGQDIVLSELPKESIKEIYFGYAMCDEDKDRITLAVSKNRIDCQLSRARICNDEYKIVFDQIEKI